MSIPLVPAIPHPTQTGVMMDKLAVETLSLKSGSSIESPAALEVTFRPFASVVVAGVEYFVTAPVVNNYSILIPDVYAWVADRAGKGDMAPLDAMNCLMKAAGEEYARKNS